MEKKKYHNISEEKKERLKEYQNNYRETKSRNIIINKQSFNCNFNDYEKIK